MIKKKSLLIAASILAILPFAEAQNCNCYPDTNALENLIVERYYVSGAGDEQDGQLPQGSITYRLYADMKPDYKLLMGGLGLTLSTSTLSAEHPLSIRTTSGGQFYNNAFGSVYGDQINSQTLGFNTVVLDSYLSMGGSSAGHIGVSLNSDTANGSILTSTSEGYLLNDNGMACQPLTFADGLLVGTPGTASALNINSDQLAMFGTENNSGPFELMGAGGQWFNLEGVVGPTEENQVLLAQFTVIGGTLEFELNLQVRIPEPLQCNASPACSWKSIIYVAQSQPEDPLFGEDASLNYVVYQKDFLNYVDSGGACTSITGLEELTKLDKQITIYPNPVDDHLSILFNQELRDVSYTLFDLTGQSLLTSTKSYIVAGQNSYLDLSQLARGTYILCIKSGNLITSKKVVKL